MVYRNTKKSWNKWIHCKTPNASLGKLASDHMRMCLIGRMFPGEKGPCLSTGKQACGPVLWFLSQIQMRAHTHTIMNSDKLNFSQHIASLCFVWEAHLFRLINSPAKWGVRLNRKEHQPLFYIDQREAFVRGLLRSCVIHSNTKHIIGFVHELIRRGGNEEKEHDDHKILNLKAAVWSFLRLK